MKINDEKLVSIVSVNYKRPDITLAMLESLSLVHYSNIEMILVDNECGAQAFPFEQYYKGNIQVIRSAENLGFAGGTNLGIRKAKGDYILLLNNDTIVSPDFLSPMVAVLEEQENIGMVCPKIYFFDHPNVIQYAGATDINKWTGRGAKIGYASKENGRFSTSQKTRLGNGACMLIRKEVFEEVGLLSQLYFMYYEEHDFTLRARQKGWDTYFCASSFIHHRQSVSIGLENPLKIYYLVRNRILFMRRFNNGLQLGLFLLYYLGLGFPKMLLKYLSKGKWRHIINMYKGLAWNLKNQKININYENISL